MQDMRSGPRSPVVAALYGRLVSERGAEKTKTAHQQITATVETWTGKVSVLLSKDGSYVVEVGPKHGTGLPVLRGNVDAAS